MEIIRNREILRDGWVHVADGDPLPAAADIIVSLERWKQEKDALLARGTKLGVRLKSDQQPAEIADDLSRLAVVALEFPRFADGRAYSSARLLRERYNYKGEVRAVGYVLRDQMFYMHRCGFNAFELHPGKDLREALEAFKDFSVTYQAAADDPRPLYRRRAR
jgi:uncharacterized protein (DUF934 family)